MSGACILCSGASDWVEHLAGRGRARRWSRDRRVLVARLRRLLVLLWNCCGLICTVCCRSRRPHTVGSRHSARLNTNSRLRLTTDEVRYLLLIKVVACSGRFCLDRAHGSVGLDLSLLAHLFRRVWVLWLPRFARLPCFRRSIRVVWDFGLPHALLWERRLRCSTIFGGGGDINTIARMRSRAAARQVVRRRGGKRRRRVAPAVVGPRVHCRTSQSDCQDLENSFGPFFDLLLGNVEW